MLVNYSVDLMLIMILLLPIVIMCEKDLNCWMINGFMLNGKTSILVMNRNKFVQMDTRSNDRTKWLTELIDRSL